MSERSLLCAIGQLGRGGTERQLFLFLKNLDRRRFRPTVASIGAGGAWAERIAALDVPIVSLEHCPTWRKPWRFRELVRKERPEAIFCWSFYANGLRYFAPRTRFVGSLRNGLATEKASINRVLFKAGLTPRKLIVNSSALDADLRAEGVPSDRIVFVPNIFDDEGCFTAEKRAERRKSVREQLNVPDDAVVVVGGGRAAPWKNYGYFIDSFATARQRCPKLRAWLVGAGPLEFKDIIRERGLEDVIVLTGEVPDAKPYLAAADLFFLSSDAEGMPNIALEALAAGAAVVATDVGGVREILGDRGEAGSIVAPKDPRAADEILRLALDPDARAALRAAGARRMATFSPEQVMPRYLAALEMT